MLYLLLKTIHIVTVLAWIGGMLAVAVLLAAASNALATGVAPALSQVRVWDRRVTTPALLIALASGVTLAMLGRWFMQPWLMIKLLLVLAMLALHGMLVGRLRRLALHSGPRLPAMSWQPACGVLAASVFIVAAVVVKPFS